VKAGKYTPQEMGDVCVCVCVCVIGSEQGGLRAALMALEHQCLGLDGYILQGMNRGRYLGVSFID
jgi:hypothetical protein